MTTYLNPRFALPEIPIADFKQRQLASFFVNPLSCCVHDAPQTNLPGTAAGDDLELTGTAVGTSSIVLETGDIKATSSTRYARFQVALPDNYDDGQTITMRLTCQLRTTVADTSCTVDLQAYKIDGEGGVGSDIVTTAATDINSLTAADVDFSITPTGVVRGDVLDCRVGIIYVDGATATAVIGQIGRIQLLCDVRG